jgi:adenine C2-methylase RlmN of 23S rRNA A2503 and tRNA A37
MGIIGDLTSGEIIEQLVHANSITRIRNVVFMGMGEPLNNYENLKKSVEFMVDTRRFAMCKLSCVRMWLILIDVFLYISFLFLVFSS